MWWWWAGAGSVPSTQPRPATPSPCALLLPRALCWKPPPGKLLSPSPCSYLQDVHPAATWVLAVTPGARGQEQPSHRGGTGWGLSSRAFSFSSVSPAVPLPSARLKVWVESPAPPDLSPVFSIVLHHLLLLPDVPGRSRGGVPSSRSHGSSRTSPRSHQQRDGDEQQPAAGLSNPLRCFTEDFLPSHPAQGASGTAVVSGWRSSQSLMRMDPGETREKRGNPPSQEKTCGKVTSRQGGGQGLSCSGGHRAAASLGAAASVLQDPFYKRRSQTAAGRLRGMRLSE